MKLQIALQKEQYSVIQNKIEADKAFRHDLRHHANLLTGLLREGKAEDALVYAQKLGNAVEHGGGASPQLSVSILQNKGQLCIRIENSFEGTAARDESGNYRSAKPQGGGIGLQSVAAIVKKYKGAMNISHTESTFTVDIAMKSIK